MESKRERRRRDLARMKARAVRIFANYGIRNAANIKLANHLAHCRNMCCGNPRKWFGEATMQERRFAAEEVI